MWHLALLYLHDNIVFNTDGCCRYVDDKLLFNTDGYGVLDLSLKRRPEFLVYLIEVQVTYMRNTNSA